MTDNSIASAPAMAEEIKRLNAECEASMAEIAAGRERAEKAEAEVERLRAENERLTALADDWQVMRDERDMAKCNYDNLLDDTNSEINAAFATITSLRAELESLKADKVRLNEAYERAVSDTAELKALRATNDVLVQLLEDDEALRAELERKDAALREAGPHLRKIAGMSCMTCSDLAWATARTVEAALSAQKEEEA